MMLPCWLDIGTDPLWLTYLKKNKKKQGKPNKNCLEIRQYGLSFVITNRTKALNPLYSFSPSACETFADTMYNTVWTLGCRPFMNGQRASCYCEGEEKDELWRPTNHKNTPQSTHINTLKVKTTTQWVSITMNIIKTHQGHISPQKFKETIRHILIQNSNYDNVSQWWQLMDSD